MSIPFYIFSYLKNYAIIGKKYLGEIPTMLRFNNKALALLFIPLIIEQLLAYFVGVADSMMVASVSENALSGVSLVDFIMQLLISIFAALATGGAVIAGQYLGRKDKESASTSINQLVWIVTVISIVIMCALYALKPLILNGLFGSITEEVPIV